MKDSPHNSFTKRGIYAFSDEKFVRSKLKRRKPDTQLDTYKFHVPSIIFTQPHGFHKNDLPIVFQATPDTLLNLAARVVDAVPLPDVYDWSNAEVCRWIRQYGYPQYQNTFRVNLITGRKLLLVDAKALSAMNIKTYAEIKHIAYGIRQLFYFTMTKFMRSITLPPEYCYKLYKLFRVSTGPRHMATRRTDLWQYLQLLREKSKSSSHWDLLERWLARQHDPVELIGEAPRRKLFRCKVQKSSPVDLPKKQKLCTCRPPCICCCEDVRLKKPTLLTVLTQHNKPESAYECSRCVTCLPPCSCRWPSKYYKFNEILSCLKTNFPNKYDEKYNFRLYTVSSIYSSTSFSSRMTNVSLSSMLR